MTNEQIKPPEDLIDRLRHFERHQLEAGDEYGAEVLHRAAKEIARLSRELEALKHPPMPDEVCALMRELREALADVMTWIEGWDPGFIHDEEWPASRDAARAALAKAKGVLG